MSQDLYLKLHVDLVSELSPWLAIFLNTNTWAVGEKDSGKSWIFTPLPGWLDSCPKSSSMEDTIHLKH